MKNTRKRLLSLILCIAMLAAFVVLEQPEVQAAHYDNYTTIATIKNNGDCYSMQGCCVDDSYIYCSKIDSENDNIAAIARTRISDGSVTWMTNSANGTNYFYQLAHANDLDIATISGVKTMFVATGAAGSGNYSLVRLAVNGTTLTQVGNYNVTYNGSSTYLAAACVMSVSDTDITLICKRGNSIFRATIGINQTSGTIPLELLFTVNLTDVTINGASKDISSFIQQGFDYYDNKVFIPMSGDDSCPESSCIISYDVDGVSGTVRHNNSDFSVWIDDITYVDLFEIESCCICPADGKMYFSTNRRIASNNANHDGVHCVKNFVYNPADNDSTTYESYRWEMQNDELVSVTEGGANQNTAKMHLGSISGGKLTGGQYHLDQAIILKYNEPWVLEWKDSGYTANSMILSQRDKSNYNGNIYLYRRKDTLVSLGTSDGSNYHNYGIKLSDHGIDGNATHVYRLENVINADGTNMVYLRVDGKLLGAMNNYYIGDKSQGTTSDWVSGKNFYFSYAGTTGHPLAMKLSYLQAWHRGPISEVDQPNMYRWETKSNKLTTIEECGLTSNAATPIVGSFSGTTYSGYQAALAKDIVLLHNRPWSVEWQSDSWSGNPMLLASAKHSKTYLAPYVYINGNMVSIGNHDGTNYQNYGLSLSDYGISYADSHVYRMTNRVNADGSNMVYLSVDGVELGAMNNYYKGGTDQNVTIDWLNGRDLTFSYVGTYQYTLNLPLGYLQVWENGIPEEDVPDTFRWEAGTSAFESITNGYTQNALTTIEGSYANGTFTEAYYRTEKPIILRHDREWSMSWQSEGSWYGNSTGAMLLSASLNRNELNAPFLYRRKESDFIAFGIRTADNIHANCGVSLSAHGIDGTVSHTYLLTNRIAADGSNMVYLSVDGKEIGPMNEYFKGGSVTGTTSDWISGKDFVFNYLGTTQFPISNCSMDYLQITEGELPTGTVEFRDWDGRLISSATYQYGETVAVPANPSRPADAANTYLFAGWDKAVTVCSGDTVYTATYTAEKIPYTVVFKDYNGMQLSSATYYYGDTVTAPVDPSRAADDAYSYTFAGWSPAVTACTGNVVYTATYTAKAHPSITPKYPSLSFEGEIFYNIYFTVTGMEDVPLTDIGLLTWSTPNTDGTIDNAAEVIAGAEVQANGYYTVHSNGIPAKKLGDLLYFKIYAKLPDGSYIYSGLYNYSAKAYAMDRLANSSNANMKALCVAMLNYGAAAQVNFSYKPYALMNADLTTEQQGLVSAYNSSMIAAVGSASPSKTVKFPYSGFSNRYPSVTFEGAFAISYYFTPSNAPDNGMKLYYWDANTYASVTSLTTANATGVVDMTQNGSAYQGTVTGIAAKEIDKTIYVAGVYSSGGTTYTTGVLPYSLGAYCTDRIANGSTTMQAFAAATAVYGYYAKTYFGT